MQSDPSIGGRVALKGGSLSVQNNAKTTGKRPGGITGKGFMPGKSGNPGGRPKKRPISDRYADLAGYPLPDDPRLMMKLEKRATYGDALALSQFRGAIKGKPEAAREIREAIRRAAAQSRQDRCWPSPIAAEFPVFPLSNTAIPHANIMAFQTWQ
jgi:hypothetical protein